MGILEEIRDELRTLNAKLAHLGGALPLHATDRAPEPATKATKPPKGVVAGATEALAKAAQALEATTSPTPVPASSAPLTYDDVKKVGLKLVQAKGRDAMVSVLAKFKGADGQPLKSAQEAKPEQYPDLIAAINKALGA
jgi:myo-inositol catabolism protein IolC